MRLERYFVSEGRDEPVLIEIPTLGLYVLLAVESRNACGGCHLLLQCPPQRTRSGQHCSTVNTKPQSFVEMLIWCCSRSSRTGHFLLREQTVHQYGPNVYLVAESCN